MVTVVQCLCPVMTAVFSWFILGEKLSMFGTVGSVIILVSLILAVYYDKASKQNKNMLKLYK